jgi:hypothetical protein
VVDLVGTSVVEWNKFEIVPPEGKIKVERFNTVDELNAALPESRSVKNEWLDVTLFVDYHQCVAPPAPGFSGSPRRAINEKSKETQSPGGSLALT